MNRTAIKPKSHDVAEKVSEILFGDRRWIDEIVSVLEFEYSNETRLQTKIEQLEISLETAHREYELIKKYGSK
jgi:hypothetical protein